LFALAARSANSTPHRTLAAPFPAWPAFTALAWTTYIQYTRAPEPSSSADRRIKLCGLGRNGRQTRPLDAGPAAGPARQARFCRRSTSSFNAAICEKKPLPISSPPVEKSRITRRGFTRSRAQYAGDSLPAKSDVSMRRKDLARRRLAWAPAGTNSGRQKSPAVFPGVPELAETCPTAFSQPSWWNKQTNRPRPSPLTGFAVPILPHLSTCHAMHASTPTPTDRSAPGMQSGRRPVNPSGTCLKARLPRGTKLSLRRLPINEPPNRRKSCRPSRIRRQGAKHCASLLVNHAGERRGTGPTGHKHGWQVTASYFFRPKRQTWTGGTP